MTQRREKPTGRYTYDPLKVCTCGHTLGSHLAEGRVAERECTEPGCGCRGFKLARKRNPVKSRIPKSVRDLALKHKVGLRLDSFGHYHVMENGKAVLSTPSPNATAANARALIRRYLRYKGNPVSTDKKFRDVHVGELFTFWSEGRPGYSTMRGPWRKTGTRTYTHALSGGEYRVGTINAKVSGSEPRGQNPEAKLKWPHMFAGGTAAAEGKHGYRSEATRFGYWTINPVSYPNGRHRGYVVDFVNDKGVVPGGLHQRLGGYGKVFRSPNAAKAAASDSYRGLLVAEGVKSNPRKKRRGRNPRRRMGKQARKDFARRMAEARIRKQAKKRIVIKRQIRRAGDFAPPETPTRALRAQRASRVAMGMYQVGALAHDRNIAWFQGNGFTRLRGNALGFPNLASAKQAAKHLQRGLVAGIFRSDVDANKARNFLLGKQ